MDKNVKNMKKNFSKMITLGIIVEILLIIFGLIMLFSPEFSEKIIGTFVGALFLLYALSLLYNYFTRDGARLYSLNFIFGLLICILGVVLIIYPYSVMDFVTICIGIYFIISAAVKINYALWLNRGKEESFMLVLANGIVLGLLGILIIFNPFANLAVTQVIGAFLIIGSAIKIANILLFKKRAKEITKIFW